MDDKFEKRDQIPNQEVATQFGPFLNYDWEKIIIQFVDTEIFALYKNGNKVACLTFDSKIVNIHQYNQQVPEASFIII